MYARKQLKEPLTKRQRDIISKLRSGWELITDISWVIIAKGKQVEKVSKVLYRNLVRKDLIDSSDAKLTEQGKTTPLKTA